MQRCMYDSNQEYPDTLFFISHPDSSIYSQFTVTEYGYQRITFTIRKQEKNPRPPTGNSVYRAPSSYSIYLASLICALQTCCFPSSGVLGKKAILLNAAWKGVSFAFLSTCSKFYIHNLEREVVLQAGKRTRAETLFLSMCCTSLMPAVSVQLRANI